MTFKEKLIDHKDKRNYKKVMNGMQKKVSGDLDQRNFLKLKKVKN